MQVIRQAAEMSHVKKEGTTLAFVPTMGVLHPGHLSLIEKAKHHADQVVVSIFVNPKQFAAGEDFAIYPRTEAADLALLEECKVDVVYLPTEADIYPDGFDAYYSTGALGQILEGKVRPHFFDGVATVVLALCRQIRPDVAVFGEKDYQQLLIIREMVAALSLPLDIIAAPIIREEDGLAMSSRNRRLSPQQRKIAPQLYQILHWVREELQQNRDIKNLQEEAVKRLLEAGFETVDYLEILCSNTLKPWVSAHSESARILAAARLGDVRLIDNLEW